MFYKASRTHSPAAIPFRRCVHVRTYGPLTRGKRCPVSRVDCAGIAHPREGHLFHQQQQRTGTVRALSASKLQLQGTQQVAKPTPARLRLLLVARESLVYQSHSLYTYDLSLFIFFHVSACVGRIRIKAGEGHIGIEVIENWSSSSSRVHAAISRGATKYLGEHMPAYFAAPLSLCLSGVERPVRATAGEFPHGALAFSSLAAVFSPPRKSSRNNQL